MAALAKTPTWREDALVARFSEEIAPQLTESELRLAPLLEPSDDRGIPAALWGPLLEHFRA
jgi:hypothetical protein